MLRRTIPGLPIAFLIASLAAACGKDSPSAPSVRTAAASSTSVQLTAPGADSPSNDEQLTTLRPTLTVRNGTSTQPSGTRTYEFQISDNSTFVASTSATGLGLAVLVSKSGVAEDASGKTSFQLDQDLQPATLYYWRARIAQGDAQSDWSAVARFNTRQVQLTAPTADSPSNDEQLSTLRPTLTVRNGTSDLSSGTRTYEFQVSDNSVFSITSTSVTFAGFAVMVSKSGVPEGTSGTTSFLLEQDLQPTTVYFWRTRLVQGSAQSAWSAVARFKTKLVGYNRAGELYDPLIFGETVGTLVGSTTFVPGKGIQLNNGTSYVRYLLPQTITSGEFSMDVEGLRANGPGDKAKVFGMQEGQDDFITNRYRVDIQYRGVNGVPPNAITFRALYGSADDLSVRYEPDTATRYASVFLLNPATTYHWMATWGREFRVVVRAGGVNGAILYNVGVSSPRGTYAPNPHYAYLGAPVGRSGTEAASIPNAIYRNVWLASHPRPASLGSALQPW